MTRSTPYALLDLVEAKTPAVQRDFVTKATQLAKDVGGHLALANKVLPPMVIPDEWALAADRATDRPPLCGEALGQRRMRGV